LSITQKDIFNSYNRNIQMMVEDHQKSQANFNTMYNIIYGFFGFILILLSLSGYIGFTTLKDLKKYARERIDSLVQKEVSNVHNEAQKKLNELGLDSDGISCTMKEVMRLQQIFYQLFQLQGSDELKDIAIKTIIYGTGNLNDLVLPQLIKLLSISEAPEIRALTCEAILIRKSSDLVLKSQTTLLLKNMQNGNLNEKSAANDVITHLKDNFKIII